MLAAEAARLGQQQAAGEPGVDAHGDPEVAYGRAIGLPPRLFADVAPKGLAGWRSRALVESPSHLQSALVYVNTLMLQDVLAEARLGGRPDPGGRRGLTPLFWTHVAPYGRSASTWLDAWN